MAPRLGVETPALSPETFFNIFVFTHNLKNTLDLQDLVSAVIVVVIP